MADKNEQKDAAEPCGCSFCIDGNKALMAGILGLLVGLLVMYVAYPALVPAETAPGTGEIVEEEFHINEAKAQEIGELLSDTFFLNTGEEADVLYSRYEDMGSHLAIYYNVSGQEVPIIVSKDYEYLYPSAVVYDQMVAEVSEAMAEYESGLEAEPEPEGYPTSAEPQVMLFVMSNCPYGNQAENGLVDAVTLLADGIAFEPVYIIYDETIHPSYSAENPECYVDSGNVTYCSMHGKYELDQGIREKMVYNRYGEAMWAQYAVAVNTQCFGTGADIETCWKTTAESLGIDAQEIEDNFEAEKFGILAHEKGLTFSMQQFGSPGLLINGVDYSGSRSSEAFKTAICSAFETEPEDCTTELSEAASAASGSCG
ncbi:hypothetical protein JW721_05990 [Candidatus Micrarchaeota archaeon]|nr:hypothetical protein [Candidatus Micrarchaeota archaeon]